MNFNERSSTAGGTSSTSRGVRIRFAGGGTGGCPSACSAGWTTARADRRQQAHDPHDRLQLRRAGRDRRRRAGARRGGTPADKIDEKAIRRHLYDPEMPDPDLVIRTSGEYRISNFLLWELAYSELVFTDVLWPDFRREHLFEAVREYQPRNRRFGGPRGAAVTVASTATRASCCAPGSWARPTASSCCSRRATARCGRSPRACARPRAASAARSSPTPTSPCSSTRAASSTRHPGRDHRPLPAAARRPRPPRPGHRDAGGVDQVAQEREPNPALYPCSSAPCVRSPRGPPAGGPASSGRCLRPGGLPADARACARCGEDGLWPSTRRRRAVPGVPGSRRAPSRAATADLEAPRTCPGCDGGGGRRASTSAGGPCRRARARQHQEL